MKSARAGRSQRDPVGKVLPTAVRAAKVDLMETSLPSQPSVASRLSRAARDERRLERRAADGRAGQRRPGESWAQERRREAKAQAARRRIEGRFAALIARLDVDDLTTQDRSHA